MTFRDEGLDSLYGSPVGISAAATFARRGRMDLAARVSFMACKGSPARVAFIERAKTELQFLPLSLQARFHHRLSSGSELWAGPQLAIAYFRERWRVSIPGAALAIDRKESGNWLAGGLAAGLRLRMGRAGAVSIGLEQLWCQADRPAVPGNDAQAGTLKGGWWTLSLAWELPGPFASSAE
jgi:hypothetical protein